MADARKACQRWHYSKTISATRNVCVGAWEDGRFIGCVVFAWGTQQHLGKMFGLKMIQCCELTRVALGEHATHTTKIVAIALKMLKRSSPGIKAVVSYADCDEGHHGGIYAGGNWYYIGKVQTNGGTPKFRVRGKLMHQRSVHSTWGKGSQRLEWLRKNIDPAAEKVYTLGKHKYVMPFDPSVAAICERLKQPYPKRGSSIDSDAPGFQPGEGGVSPTDPLHLHKPTL